MDSQYRVREVTGSSWLYYDGQSGAFTVGSTLTGGTSGDTATVVGDVDLGTFGALLLTGNSGVFEDDEAITDAGTGAAVADGVVGQEPVSTADLKSHLRVDIADDDDLIAVYGQAAREQVESFCRVNLVPKIFDWYLDEFPEDATQFPVNELGALTSVKYLDEDGNEQTVSSSTYRLDEASIPARIYLEYDQSWPTSLRSVNNQVYLRFCTYPFALQQRHKVAIRQLVGNWYENRESVVVGSGVNQLPDAVKMLLWGVRSEVLV